jgi:glutamate-5-semialdehyde dehydrogenase
MSLTNGSPEAAAAAARDASFTLASLPTSARNEALDAIHAALAAAKDDILAANARDLELARKAAADGALSQALVSRLDLGKKGKWEDMLQGILDVRDLEDPGMSNLVYEQQSQVRCCHYHSRKAASYKPKPVANNPHTVGKTSLRTKLDDDLILERVSCPIGVLLIIFEARPEVIANIASLAIKSGNAAILKGRLSIPHRNTESTRKIKI